MEELRDLFSPKQPFFVLASSQYYKCVIMNYGISHFYSFIPNVNIDNLVSIVPDGSVDIIFRCGINKPEAYIYGTVLKYGTSKFIKGDYYFGVRFLPGKAVLPHKIKISDLVEDGISLWDVVSDRKMIEQITSSKDFKYQIRTFMRAYMKRFDSIDHDYNIKELKGYLVDEILKSRGNVKIDNLAFDAGYSTRYISKVFNSEFGMSPKTFCKFMRFQNLLNNLNERGGNEEITDIALDCGYFDHSHLVKDFRTFTNLTPKKYLNKIKEGSYKNRLILLQNNI